MAKNILVNLDLNGNQLLNVTAQVLATAPSVKKEGQFYYNSTNKRLEYYNGEEWVVLTTSTPNVSDEHINQLIETKVNSAKQELKTYSDKVKTDLLNSAGEDYDTFKEIEEIIKSNAESLSQIQNVTKKYVEEIGDGVALEHTVTHNLNSRDVIVQLRTSNAPYEQVIADIEHTDENNVKIKTASPITSENKITVIIIG